MLRRKADTSVSCDLWEIFVSLALVLFLLMMRSSFHPC